MKLIFNEQFLMNMIFDEQFLMNMIFDEQDFWWKGFLMNGILNEQDFRWTVFRSAPADPNYSKSHLPIHNARWPAMSLLN